MKILIAVDGSPFSLAAARYVARHFTSLGTKPQVELLHAHVAIPVGIAGATLGRKAVQSYYEEESRKALAPVERELAKSGVAFKSSWCAGDPAAEIARYASESGADVIVMGSHGHTALASLALGSVTAKTIALAKVPVLVVTRDAALAADRKQRKSGG